MNILILQGLPRANGNTDWKAEEHHDNVLAAGCVQGTTIIFR